MINFTKSITNMNLLLALNMRVTLMLWNGPNFHSLQTPRPIRDRDALSDSLVCRPPTSEPRLTTLKRLALKSSRLRARAEELALKSSRLRAAPGCSHALSGAGAKAFARAERSRTPPDLSEQAAYNPVSRQLAQTSGVKNVSRFWWESLCA